MKFTFLSEQYGTTVEISFEATHIDQIREMFDQFLRGSGFHVPDVDEEIFSTADESEISVTSDNLWVGLTDEEVHEAAIKCVTSGQSVNAAIRAIEAKLKELNK